jgi:hypothetical protein
MTRPRSDRKDAEGTEKRPLDQALEERLGEAFPGSDAVNVTQHRPRKATIAPGARTGAAAGRDPASDIMRALTIC